VIAGQGCKICTSDYFDPTDDDLIIAFKSKDTDLYNLLEDDIFLRTAGQVYYRDYEQLLSDERRAEYETGIRSKEGSAGDNDLVNVDEPGRNEGAGIYTEDGIAACL
jgi:hypothetical protein